MKKLSKRLIINKKNIDDTFIGIRYKDKKAAFTRLVKHFRSNPLTALLRSRMSRFSQTKFRNCVAHTSHSLRMQAHKPQQSFGCSLCNSYGFTLAETMVVLIVIGIIAVITVPSLIGKQIDAANRTKVKKAISTYERALNTMVVVNKFRKNAALETFGGSNLAQNTCENTTEYFKKVEGEGCRFMTMDKVWWDITDITNPIIILDNNLRTQTLGDLQILARTNSNRTVFAMTGEIDDNTGALRINDNAYESGKEDNEDNRAYLAKLFGFINPQTINGNGGGNAGGNADGGITTTCGMNGSSPQPGFCKTVDSNGKILVAGWGCENDDINNCNNYRINIYDSNGNMITYGSTCSENDISTCNKIYQYAYDNNNREIANGKNCELNGGITSCSELTLRAYNGNMITTGMFCSTYGDFTSCGQVDHRIYDNQDRITTYGWACEANNTNISTCTGISYYEFDNEGNSHTYAETRKDDNNPSLVYLSTYSLYNGEERVTAIGSNCGGSTNISDCSGNIEYYTYDSDGNETAHGYNCNKNGNISSCTEFSIEDEDMGITIHGYDCSGSYESCNRYEEDWGEEDWGEEDWDDEEEE